MKQKKWLWASVLIVALLALGIWALNPKDDANGGSAKPEGGVATWFKRDNPLPNVEQAATSASAASAPEAASKPMSVVDNMILPVFHATAQGRLLLNQDTAVGIDRIVSLFSRDEGMAKLDIQSADLPDQARRDLKDLYQRYTQYSQALVQAIPPGQAVESVDELIQQFNRMHELRAQYLGDAAQPLFGEMEKTQKELLDSMAKANPNLSMEEKAQIAQEAYTKNHPTKPTVPSATN